MNFSPTLDDLFGPLSDLDQDFEDDTLGGSDQWSHVELNTSHLESVTSTRGGTKCWRANYESTWRCGTTCGTQLWIEKDSEGLGLG